MKAYWEELLYEVYPGKQIILTNDIGSIIHQRDWPSFIAARLPCLAWYGRESTDLLLLEIRKKREVLTKHLIQLCVTEAVVHYAEEGPTDRPRVCVDEPSYPVVENVSQGVPEGFQEWGFLNHVAASEYVALVEQTSNPSSLQEDFGQEEEGGNIDLDLDELERMYIEF